MIKCFFGDDRVAILKRIKQEFSDGYEVFEGENISKGDLQNIFFGVSLFVEDRKIVIKDLSEDKEAFSELKKYIETPHSVILWESKLDKRTSVFKELEKAGVKFLEFKVPESKDKNLMFDIFDVAMRNGKKAISMVEKIEMEQDPFMFVGLLSTQAIKKFDYFQGRKEKRVLKELSKLDMLMKSTSIEPWTLVKLSLLKFSSL